MKKRISTFLLILWVCFRVEAQVQLTSVKTVGANNTNHRYLATINNRCLFTETLSNGIENVLLATDGTSGGTVMLGKNLIVGQNKKQFFQDGGKLFYLVRNNEAKSIEIWRTDGSATATMKVSEIADTAFASNSNYYLLKSDNYYYFVGYGATQKKTFISQFDKEFRLLTKESSTGKYVGFPLVFKDLLFVGNKLFRTSANAANTDLNNPYYPDMNENAVAGNKLYFRAYNQNELYEYDGVNTKSISLPDGTHYFGGFINRIYALNNQLHLLNVIIGEGEDALTSPTRDFKLNSNTGVFEQAFLYRPWGQAMKVEHQGQNTYMASYFKYNGASNLNIYKMAYESDLGVTNKRFPDNQIFSIVLSNGNNLFVLKKDYLNSDHILYDADTQKIISLPADIVFNEFIGEIKAGLWLMSGKKGNTGEGLYTMDENTGSVSFIKEDNPIGQGIQKLYKLDDKTLIWSSPEKNGMVIYKSDGTKKGTIALKTLPSVTNYPYSTEYDKSVLSNGSLLVTNLRKAIYDTYCSVCSNSLLPLIFISDGTVEGTKTLFEANKPIWSYDNSKVGNLVYHAFIRSDEPNKLMVLKNSVSNNNLASVDSVISKSPLRYFSLFGENIVYSPGSNGSYGFIGSGSISVEPGTNPEFIGSVNKNPLFKSNIITSQCSIYTLQGSTMVKLFTMEPYTDANAYNRLLDNLADIVFGGDAEYIYVTGGSLSDTKKIPILFKDYRLSGSKIIEDTYYFLFSKTLNGTTTYRVQTYKNGTTEESSVSNILFDLTPVKIENTLYLHRYAFSGGVGLEIYRFENGVLSKDALIGNDYEYFPVRTFPNGILANPYGKVILWTPGNSYEIAQGVLGEAVELNEKYIFVIRGNGKQQVYATVGKGAKAQLLKEFTAPEIHLKVIENKVYFSAGTPEAGVEPWVTDGTTEGTRMIGDLWKGPQSSNPDIFFMTSVNGIPVCLASTPDLGRQLFSLQVKLAQPIIGVPNTEACEGETIVLTAPKDFDSYKWTINETEEVIKTDNKLAVTKSGNYKLIVGKDGNSSEPSNAVTVLFKPLPAKPIIKMENNQLGVTATGTLQWYLNDTAIPGATTNTLTFNSNGDYSVKVTVNGCAMISDKQLVAITSIEQEWAETVYPNPAHNKLMVKTNDSQAVQLKLIDVKGKVVLQQRLIEPANEIDLRNFSKGVYILQLNQHTKKIIIE